jgi:hypothetical protein
MATRPGAGAIPERRAIGAEVVVGDLTRAGDAAHAMEGCRRLDFGMSVSAPIRSSWSRERR